MCSDMDIEDMAKDIDFAKKWMFAIAMCLKKDCIYIWSTLLTAPLTK